MRPAFRIVTITLFVSSALSFPLRAMGNWEIVDCVSSEISQGLKPGSALSKLKALIDSPQNKLADHKLEITSTGAKLTIGVLMRDQKRFLSLCARALEEGSLQEIDAGAVIGPKVFIMLNHLMWRAPKSRANVIIKGSFSEYTLKAAREQHSAGGVTNSRVSDPHAWTQQEVKDFNAAVQELGLSRCHAKQCEFFIKISNGQAAILLTADGKPI